MKSKSTVVKIMNSKGLQLKEVLISEHDRTIDLSFLQRGEYLLKLISEKSIRMQRVFKKV